MSIKEDLDGIRMILQKQQERCEKIMQSFAERLTDTMLPTSQITPFYEFDGSTVVEKVAEHVVAVAAQRILSRVEGTSDDPETILRTVVWEIVREALHVGSYPRMSNPLDGVLYQARANAWSRLAADLLPMLSEKSA